jgi:hypothetical protein
MTVNKWGRSGMIGYENINKNNGFQRGHPVRDAGVAGSNPTTPTKISITYVHR